ncbi:hypothetical protein [Halobaculum sp. D14]|uniref:hypothetical protein n=1 Tax=Halobaculum sp. D14 TaxID=3421642 RepID=UPI003EB74614
MDHIQQWLQTLHDRKISNDYDRIVIVLGEEGNGKSTFILGAMELWYQILGRCPADTHPDPDRLLDHVVFDDPQAFRQQVLDSDAKDPIAAMDAAHILHKKTAMHGEQIKTEKSLLDIRIENFLILLGYQDWADVPDQLQRRRAKNVLHIPRRGVVHGYSRQSMDEKYESGDWPDPDLVDTFPALDGRDLWAKFNEMDRERKEERLEEDQEPDAEDVAWQAKAEMAVYLVKPWSSDGMTQGDAGSAVGYSQKWVSDRCQEWERGELEPELLQAIPEPQHGGVMPA